jgi:hypothetical protein
MKCSAAVQRAKRGDRLHAPVNMQTWSNARAAATNVIVDLQACFVKFVRAHGIRPVASEILPVGRPRHIIFPCVWAGRLHRPWFFSSFISYSRCIDPRHPVLGCGMA